MKLSYLSILLLLGFCASGQTLFYEDFDDEVECATSGVDNGGSGYAWSSTCVSATQCDNTMSFCGVDAGFGNFEFKNLDDTGEPGFAEWTSDPIDVDESLYEEVSVRVVTREFSNPDGSSCFDVRYSTDGGTFFTIIGSICGDFTEQEFFQLVTVVPGTQIVVRVLCSNPGDFVLVLDEVEVVATMLSQIEIPISLSESNGMVEVSTSISSPGVFQSLELQRSEDGTNFTTLMTQSSSEDLSSPYLFADSDPREGLSFYRWVGYHADGSQSFSKVESIQRRSSAQWSATLISRDLLQISSTEDFGESQKVEIVDLSGRSLYSQWIGTTPTVLPVQDWGSVFFVRISDRSDFQVFKILR